RVTGDAGAIHAFAARGVAGLCPSGSAQGREAHGNGRNRVATFHSWPPLSALPLRRRHRKNTYFTKAMTASTRTRMTRRPMRPMPHIIPPSIIMSRIMGKLRLDTRAGGHTLSRSVSVSVVHHSDISRGKVEMGQKLMPRHRGAMPALPSKADIRLTLRHVRFVPLADICSAANCALFDHLVGAGEKGCRNRKADRFCGFDVDDEFELGGLIHRQVDGRGAIKNASHVDSCAAI